MRCTNITKNPRGKTVTLIKITSYKQNNPKNWYTIPVSKYPSELKKYYHSEYSLFEIINKPNINLFLDVEYVPRDNKYGIHYIYHLYTNLLNALYGDNEIKSEIMFKSLITINKKSKHPGYSYHVYTPIVVSFSDIRNYILYFISEYPEYGKYIDASVYTKNRLFRVPGTIDPVTKDINGTHEIMCFSDYKNCRYKSMGLITMSNNDILKACISNINQKYMYDNKLKSNIGKNIGYFIYKQLKLSKYSDITRKHNYIQRNKDNDQDDKDNNQDDKDNNQGDKYNIDDKEPEITIINNQPDKSNIDDKKTKQAINNDQPDKCVNDTTNIIKHDEPERFNINNNKIINICIIMGMLYILLQILYTIQIIIN